MTHHRTRNYTASLLSVLATGLISFGQAQTTNFLVAQFDADTTGQFTHWGTWGTAYPIIVWDGAVNQTTTLGPNTAGSGSVQWTIDWSVDPPDDQVMETYRFPNSAVLNLVNYTHISFDIRFDPSSATDGAGSYGGVEVDWVPQSDGWPSKALGTAFFYVTNSNWVHVEMPFDASSDPKLSAVTQVGFKIPQDRTGAPLTGNGIFWLDNVILHGRTATVPPPTLSLAPVKTPPGLMVVAPGGGNGYRRGMIRTLDPVNGLPYYSWLGQGATPVTYSLTIASYPTSYYYFQSQIFLVPNGDNNASVDWTAPTVLALDIRNAPGGLATATLRYKVNHPSANAEDFKPAVLVCSNGVLGTWSMTFLHDTNVTVTAPNGTSTNFALPESAAMEFYNPLSAYFGNQQNGAANAGQASTYSRVRITGVTTSPEIDETFAGPDLNPDPLNAKWKVVGEMPSCVFIVRPDHKWWVNWTLPDTGFTLQGSPTLGAGTWVTDPQWTNLVNTALGNRMLIPESSLPSASKSFFRMMKPAP